MSAQADGVDDADQLAAEVPTWVIEWAAHPDSPEWLDDVVDGDLDIPEWVDDDAETLAVTSSRFSRLHAPDLRSDDVKGACRSDVCGDSTKTADHDVLGGVWRDECGYQKCASYFEAVVEDGHDGDQEGDR